MAQMTTASNRTFGVEIECVVPDQSALMAALRAADIDTSGTNGWRIKYDGSLRNTRPSHRGAECREIVSPILSGNNGLEQVRKVCRALRSAGVGINITCGLHVHHGANDLQINDWKCLVKRYAKAEYLLDPIVAPSRRRGRSHWCKYLVGSGRGSATIAEYFTKVDRPATFPALRQASGNDRYQTINLESFGAHHTVEFRHHGASINPAKIVGWILLTQAMVEQCKRTDFDILRPVPFEFGNWLSGLRRRGNLCEVAIRYWRRRYQLATNPETDDSETDTGESGPNGGAEIGFLPPLDDQNATDALAAAIRNSMGIPAMRPDAITVSIDSAPVARRRGLGGRRIESGAAPEIAPTAAIEAVASRPARRARRPRATDSVA